MSIRLPILKPIADIDTGPAAPAEPSMPSIPQSPQPDYIPTGGNDLGNSPTAGPGILSGITQPPMPVPPGPAPQQGGQGLLTSMPSFGSPAEPTPQTDIVGSLLGIINSLTERLSPPKIDALSGIGDFLGQTGSPQMPIGPTEFEGFSNPVVPEPRVDFTLPGFNKGFLGTVMPNTPVMESKMNRLNETDLLGKIGMLAETGLPKPVEDVMQVIPAFSGVGLIKKLSGIAGNLSIKDAVINVAKKQWDSGKGDIVTLDSLASEMGTAISNSDFLQSIHKVIVSGDLIPTGSHEIKGKTAFLTETGLTPSRVTGNENIVTGLRIPGLELPEAREAFFGSVTKVPVDMVALLAKLREFSAEQKELYRQALEPALPKYHGTLDSVLKNPKSTPEDVARTIGALRRENEHITFRPIREIIDDKQQMDMYRLVQEARDNEVLSLWDTVHANEGLDRLLNGVIPQPAQLNVLERVWPGISEAIEKMKPSYTPLTSLSESGPQSSELLNWSMGEQMKEGRKLVGQLPLEPSTETGPLISSLMPESSKLDEVIRARLQRETITDLEKASSLSPFKPEPFTESLPDEILKGTQLSLGPDLPNTQLPLSSAAAESSGPLSILDEIKQAKLPNTQLDLPEAPLGSSSDLASAFNLKFSPKERDPINWGRELLNLLNLPKMFKSSVDLSAPLRQAVLVAYGHPIETAKATWGGVKSFASEKAFNDLMSAIEANPYNTISIASKTTKDGKKLAVMPAAGLELTEMGPKAKLSKMEEAFMSAWASAVPWIRSSNRGYVAILNKLRADRFTLRAREMEHRLGVQLGDAPLKEYERIANAVNIMTGRGPVGGLEDMIPALNAGLYSFRLQSARISTPGLLVSKSPEVRKEVARALVSFITVNLGLMYILDKAGIASVELDSNSSDYGKLKFGNTRIDPWGGFQQYVVLASRLYSEKTKNQLGQSVPAERGDILTKFARSKASPTVGSALNAISGETIVGEDVSPGGSTERVAKFANLDKEKLSPVESAGLATASYIWDLLGPMSIEDFADALRHGGDMSVATAPLIALGTNVQTYEPTLSLQLKDELSTIAGTPWDSLKPSEQAKLRRSNPEVLQAEERVRLEQSKKPLEEMNFRAQIESGKFIQENLNANILQAAKEAGVQISGPARSIAIPNTGHKYYLDDTKYRRYQELVVWNYNQLKLPKTWQSMPTNLKDKWFDGAKEFVGDKARGQLLREIEQDKIPPREQSKSLLDSLGESLDSTWEKSVPAEMISKAGSGDYLGAGRTLAAAFNPALEEGFGEGDEFPGQSAAKLSLGMAGSVGTPLKGVFFSKLGQVLDSAKVTKTSGSEWLSYLKGHGVKDSEIRATGLDELLKDGKFTKQELQEAFDVNKIEVEEVVKGLQKEVPWNYEKGSWDYSGEPKFDQSDLSLPGGENYKELLLTLPKEQLVKNPDFGKFAGEREFITLAERSGSTDLAQNFVGSHYSEPNILAHTRFNDRTDINGKKTLFVEEIQSDWAQKPRQLKSDLEAKIITQKSYDIQLAEWEATNIPMPETADWTSLISKRLMKYAADNGYDQIAWTTGKQQADRYNLAKSVDSLVVNKSGGLTPSYQLRGFKDGRQVVNIEGLSKNELSNNVGKDLASKILTDPKVEAEIGTEFKVTDLEVGGSGMKGYYDNIVPAVMSKLGKQFGAKTFETKISEIPGFIERGPDKEARIKYLEANDRLRSVHAVDVRPAMSQPWPLFMLIPPMRKDDKVRLSDGRQ